jgi:HEAT repeat protein
MVIEVLVVYSKEESAIANELIAEIIGAGLNVWHRDTVLIGDSITAEVSKALDKVGPVVLCATSRAVGAKWTRRIIHAARERNKNVFIVQMDEDADVEALSFGEKVSDYYNDSTKAIDELIYAINSTYSLLKGKDTQIIAELSELQNHYIKSALKFYDIIDLTNLPDSEKNLTTKRIELRQLYVPLRIKPFTNTNREIHNPSVIEFESSSLNLTDEELKQRKEDFAKEQEVIKANLRTSVGEQLIEKNHIVILGDPGSGKTTLLRWISTAYLLQSQKSSDLESFPDIQTLQKINLLPFIIKCRVINQLAIIPSHEELFNHSLLQSEAFSIDESSRLAKLFQEKLKTGELLLLIDGLDEISDVTKRAQFCEQIEQMVLAHSTIHVIVTSRIVGYKEIGHQLSSFEHFQVDELTRDEKNDFARSWCKLTEPLETRKLATKELIEDIHSSDRIERLTGNPMMLTTVALVKKKGGRLPSRRIDLYWDAFEVLLNWRRSVDPPIGWREALPQLALIAYEMCRRGIQQMRQDEILPLLEQIRQDFPNDYNINNASPENFLDRLEKRTGILIKVGYQKHLGISYPVYEFRHLTFQEYLAAQALIKGYYPSHKGQKLTEKVGSLAGQISQNSNNNTLNTLKEESVGENWSETLRLCVSACDYDEVDSVLISILQTRSDENVLLTERPRVCLAALCLGEEPNSSQDTAKIIIHRLVKFIPTIETNEQDSMSKKIESAIKDLGRTRWLRLLKQSLYEELLNRTVKNRIYIINLLALVIGKNLPENSYDLIQWQSNQVIQFELNSESQTIETALSLFHLTNKKNTQKLEIASGLISKLLDMLDGSHLSSHIAALTFRNLNREDLKILSWRPTKFDLDRFLKYVESDLTDLGCVKNLINILGREKYYPSFEVILSRLQTQNELTEIACINALALIGNIETSKYIVPFVESSRKPTKMAAIKALGELKNPTSIEFLKGKLDNSETDICSQIIKALEKIGGQSVEDTLLSLISEQPVVEIKSSAIKALSSINRGKYNAAFWENLDDANSSIRSASISALIGFLDTSTIEKYLKDPEEKVRMSAVGALYTYNQLEKHDLYKDIIINETNPLVRFYAMFDLGYSGNEELIRTLVKLLLTGERVLKIGSSKALNLIVTRWVRTGISKALNPIPSRGGVIDLLNPLLEKLEDADYENLVTVIDTLSGLDEEIFISKLKNFIYHYNPQVRESSIKALNKLNKPEFVSLFIDRLADSESTVRQSAINALENLKEKSGLDELINYLKDNSIRVRYSAASAVGTLEMSSAEDSLLALLNDDYWFVRSRAFGSLLKIKSNKLFQIILERLDWEVKEIQVQMVGGLGIIKDLKAYEVLQKLLAYPDKEIREASANSLVSLAYDVYDSGKIEESLDMFEDSLAIKSNEVWSNNAAFCALILNKIDVAERHLNSLSFSKNQDYALFKNNKAIQTYLSKNKELAIEIIFEAINWVKESKDKAHLNVHAVLILKNGTPTPIANLPVDAALFFNLYMFGGISKENLKKELSERYPNEFQSWIELTLA